MQGAGYLEAKAEQCKGVLPARPMGAVAWPGTKKPPGGG